MSRHKPRRKPRRKPSKPSRKQRDRRAQRARDAYSRHRHGERRMTPVNETGRWCATCDKAGLGRKAAAARAATLRRQSGEAISAYRCPAGGGWHVGHVPSGDRREEIVERMERRGLSSPDSEP